MIMSLPLRHRIPIIQARSFRLNASGDVVSRKKGGRRATVLQGSHAPVGTLFSVPLLLAVIHQDIPSLIVKERGSFEFVSAFRDYPRLPACAKDHIHCWEAR